MNFNVSLFIKHISLLAEYEQCNVWKCMKNQDIDNVIYTRETI